MYKIQNMFKNKLLELNQNTIGARNANINTDQVNLLKK